jgi:hypothetical protein
MTSAVNPAFPYSVGGRRFVILEFYVESHDVERLWSLDRLRKLNCPRVAFEEIAIDLGRAYEQKKMYPQAG